MVAGAPDVIRRFGILRDIGFGPCIHVARYGQSTVHQYDTADFVLDFRGFLQSRSNCSSTADSGSGARLESGISTSPMPWTPWTKAEISPTVKESVVLECGRPL